MFIGVVSDTHNNLKNINLIVSLFNQRKLCLVIHTGDITNASSLDKFSNLNCKLYGVYGNNDRNEKGLKEVISKYNFKILEPPHEISINDRKIAIFHEPDPINKFISTNKDIDIILHGHTHRFREERIGRSLIFNPGESAGFLKDKNAIGIINLKDLSTERIFF
tara:strand:+ start:1379 stop:1870 length:492 start_codon:yes stop_codon:yes gene_type:complete